MSDKIVDSVISGSFEKEIANKERDVPSEKTIDIQIVRNAEGILTDYVTKKFFNHEETLYSFLSIICNTFQNVIDIYSAKKNIKAGDIIFIYKGGNIMRIVSKEFWLDLPSYASKNLTDFYERYFSRSDADFSIYINPVLKDFDIVFKEISLISYLILGLIRKKILKSPHKYFDIYRYNKSYISKTLRSLLLKVNSVEGLKYDHIALDGIREDGKDFKLKSSHDKITTGKLKKDTKLISPNGTIFVNKMKEYLDIDRNGNHAIFALIRTKVKFNVWSGDVMNKLWGELIDVTVIHKKYHGIDNFFANLNNYITRYDLVYNSIERLSFYSYSLDYLILDLEDILLYNEKYIWMNNKYQKRVKRLMYLYFMEIFITEQNGSSRIKIYKNLQRYIEGNLKGSFFKEEKHAIYNLVDYIERIKIGMSDSEQVLLDQFKREISVNIEFILSVLDGLKDYCSIDGKIKLGLLYETKDSILK